MKFKLLLLLFGICISAFAQKIHILNTENPEVSFRGLSVVDDHTLWVSGSKGTIGVSTDGGKSFKWVNPKGYESEDFRAIEAFDDKTAIAIAIASPGIILKTEDGGTTWREVFRDEHKEVFLDAVNFSAEQPNHGIAIGDPVEGKSYILETNSAGDSWKRVENKNLELKSGEAFFAASNSNIKLSENESYFMATGGSVSRLMFVTDNEVITVDLPKSTSETAGINGLDYLTSENLGILVGGDFQKPESDENNLFLFHLNPDNSLEVQTTETAPKGYKSGVAIRNDSQAVSCGLMGTDISVDGGRNWKNISDIALHTCKKSKKGNKIFLAGPKGRIAVLED